MTMEVGDMQPSQEVRVRILADMVPAEVTRPVNLAATPAPVDFKRDGLYAEPLWAYNAKKAPSHTKTHT